MEHHQHRAQAAVGAAQGLAAELLTQAAQAERGFCLDQQAAAVYRQQMARLFH